MADRRKTKTKRKRLPLSRPATPQDIVDRARQYGPACVDTLADVAANGSDASRVSAAAALLDRGFGKVKQGVELSGAITLADLAAKAAEVTAEASHA